MTLLLRGCWEPPLAVSLLLASHNWKCLQQSRGKQNGDKELLYDLSSATINLMYAKISAQKGGGVPVA